MTGWFANVSWSMIFVTQIVFYGLPWLSWNGRQAVLFDIAARKFYIFGIVFWPQDVIYLTVLLIIAALSLFLFTAMAGRLWCGYACPQTVYTQIFLWVERRIEGDRAARMRLDREPMSAAQARQEGGEARDLDRDRALDRHHVRRLLHAVPAAARGDSGQPRRLGDVLDPVLRPRHLRQRRATCASRSASTCVRTRASSP